ncbi:hypothetical protein EDB74_111168 [Vibrio crassostreae]|uniref:hypothetical protein n=1 Tax=Vibrio crassostreae TaxID=246167 RepID=UPI001053D173|nr:hypothetical protein [Vibrio crassostreae]TCV59543.1 hypothetical protein EDB74_111168 [Vibrio crassostreae]
MREAQIDSLKALVKHGLSLQHMTWQLRNRSTEEYSSILALTLIKMASTHLLEKNFFSNKVCAEKITSLAWAMLPHFIEKKNLSVTEEESNQIKARIDNFFPDDSKITVPDMISFLEKTVSDHSEKFQMFEYQCNYMLDGNIFEDKNFVRVLLSKSNCNDRQINEIVQSFLSKAGTKFGRVEYFDMGYDDFEHNDDLTGARTVELYVDISEGDHTIYLAPVLS